MHVVGAVIHDILKVEVVVCKMLHILQMQQLIVELMIGNILVIDIMNDIDNMLFQIE
jgi:hypothetical protein